MSIYVFDCNCLFECGNGYCIAVFRSGFDYDYLLRDGKEASLEKRTGCNLAGARVSAPDLRAGAALVIAGLAAEGFTVVDDIVYIQRGYERFEDKLRSLGAEIERVSSEKEIQKFQLRIG